MRRYTSRVLSRICNAPVTHRSHSAAGSVFAASRVDNRMPANWRQGDVPAQSPFVSDRNLNCPWRPTIAPNMRSCTLSPSAATRFTVQSDQSVFGP